MILFILAVLAYGVAFASSLYLIVFKAKGIVRVVSVAAWVPCVILGLAILMAIRRSIGA